jgi:hypothetical protein
MVLVMWGIKALPRYVRWRVLQSKIVFTKYG